MRNISEKTNYHTIRTLKMILLLITFSTRSEVVEGQISAIGTHHAEYEVAPSLHNSANTNRGEDDVTNGSNRLNSNGEILAQKSPPLSAQEPTCEELRAMWIFSKRQSRAAEISNEIPTYRDPFAYNIWEPIYPSSRSIGSRMISPFRETSRPVFGRVISREPVVLQRYPGSRAKFFEDVSRLYGSESRSAIPALPVGIAPRRYMQYRFSGSPVATPQISTSNNANVIHQGSFQKLKDLIWTERAKELSQQRRTEEMEARAAALKEITAGERYHSHQEQRMTSSLADENLSPDQEIHYQHNTDSRLSATYPDGVIKSIFSGNPLSNTGRTARVVIPNMIRGVAEHDSVQNLQMRPSHFRERNRALFRKSMPSEYYQRNIRSEHPRVNSNDATDTNELSSLARFSSSTNNMGGVADSDYHRYHSSPLLSKKHHLTGIQQQFEDLYNNILQLDKALYPMVYHQRPLNYGNNALIGANRLNRRDNFSNDYLDLSYSSDNNNNY